MQAVVEEMARLLRDMQSVNADFQAQLNAQRIVIKALIVSHGEPRRLHEALRDEMDSAADAASPARAADTAEFVGEYVQALLPSLGPRAEER